ncbi:MAG: two-component sensor histidine kinase [Acidobacteria bacterium]|nr:MAG: two-component sensor histidine kinase [Acidobacteriota bacterium]
MKRVSIRVKLTAWYVAILLASLSLFGIAAFVAMRKGIEKSVDENLEGQADGVEEVMGRVLQEEPARLQDELREHQELREQADFLQVCDQNGRWIYRSRLMTSHEIPVPAKANYSAYNVISVDLPLRVLVREISAGGDTYRIQVAAPMDDFYDAIDRFKWMVLLLSPLVLVLASAGGYWLSRRALAPVDQITRAAQDINSSNLAKRLDVPQSGDELQRLSETLNSMLGRLESSFNRITQFTADASHELRTPLALMRTTTEVSLRTSQTVAEYREAQQEVLSELEKTSSLLEKLMLLARADAIVETLQRAPVNVAEYLRDACKDGQILAEAKELKFAQDIDAQQLFVEGDSHALQRLFLILIDNAVKYTPPGGSVIVGLRLSNGSAVAEFRDTGIGISAVDLPNIFDRFYRADKARSREFGGVGLGLSIARWLAEAHRGSIEVQSTPGTGSLFIVRLPVLQS